MQEMFPKTFTLQIKLSMTSLKMGVTYQKKTLPKSFQIKSKKSKRNSTELHKK